MDAIKCTACGHDAEDHSSSNCLHEDKNEFYDCLCQRSRLEVEQAAEITRLREALQTYERTLRNAGDLKHNQLIEIADEIRAMLQEKP
jgi:hypothetical protein